MHILIFFAPVLGILFGLLVGSIFDLLFLYRKYIKVKGSISNICYSHTVTSTSWMQGSFFCYYSIPVTHHTRMVSGILCFATKQGELIKNKICFACQKKNQYDIGVNVFYNPKNPKVYVVKHGLSRMGIRSCKETTSMKKIHH